MSFRGNIAELPLGQDGLTGTKDQVKIGLRDLIDVDSITYESGTLRKMGGAIKYNSTVISGAPSILGGWDWFASPVAQRGIILADNGKLYKSTDGSTWGVELKTGLTVTDPTVPVFVEAGKEAAANNRKLFIFTGRNVVQVLSADGATTSNISTPPSDWSGSNQPTTGLNHEDRLWGCGNANDPHRLYYSLTTNHEDFTTSDAGSIVVYPGEGERIVGAISYLGYIICWKFPKGIYVVDTTSPTIANWKVSRITGELGGVSVQGQKTVDDGSIVFLDSSGLFYRIVPTDTLQNISIENLSEIRNMGPFLRENVNLGRLDRAQSVFYPALKEYYTVVPALNSTTQDRRITIDFNLPDKPRFGWSERDTNVSIWVRQDSNNIQRPVIGDNAGFVYILDTVARTKDGAGYLGLFQGPHVDLSHVDPILGTRRKNGRFLELVVEPKGNWNLNIDIYWDGELHETVTFNMGTTGATLGSFVLGTDSLAGDRILNKKRRITGGGRRISVAGRNNGASQDFSVSKFFLHYALGDERIS